MAGFFGSADRRVRWAELSSIANAESLRAQRGMQNTIFFSVVGDRLFVDAPEEFDLTCGVAYYIPKKTLAMPDDCSIDDEQPIREDLLPRIRAAILNNELRTIISTPLDDTQNNNPQR